MSRRANRENALIALYIHLLREQTLDEILKDNKESSLRSDFINYLYLDDEMYSVSKNAIERKSIYEKALNNYLKHWRFDRLGFMEQAVLILACSELEFGIQDKVVIVNEAVRLSKDYADEDSYRLINGVLDAL